MGAQGALVAEGGDVLGKIVVIPARIGLWRWRCQRGQQCCKAGGSGGRR